MKLNTTNKQCKNTPPNPRYRKTLSLILDLTKSDLPDSSIVCWLLRNNSAFSNWTSICGWFDRIYVAEIGKITDHYYKRWSNVYYDAPKGPKLTRLRKGNPLCLAPLTQISAREVFELPMWLFFVDFLTGLTFVPFSKLRVLSICDILKAVSCLNWKMEDSFLEHCSP